MPSLNNAPGALRLVLTFAFMALLAALSLVPGIPQPGDSEFVWAVARTPTLLQKTMHIVLYGLLAGLWLWTLSRSTLPRPHRTAAAAAICILYGVAMELGQLVVPGRFASLYDVLLDTAGVVVALLVIGWQQRSR